MRYSYHYVVCRFKKAAQVLFADVPGLISWVTPVFIPHTETVTRKSLEAHFNMSYCINNVYINEDKRYVSICRICNSACCEYMAFT